MKPDEIAQLLEASGRAFEAELAALPADAACWHPAPGVWPEMGNAQRFSIG